MAVNPKPEGYHNVTPYLVVEGGAKLLDFVKQVLDAEETFKMDAPGGKVGHAEVRIGDSVVMLADSTEEWSPMPASLHVYVDDCDKTFQKAVEAGATSLREPADQFYGDRTGTVRDPFGNMWSFATHVEDVSEEEMAKRVEEASQQS